MPRDEIASRKSARGRGALIQPANRFVQLHVEEDCEHAPAYEDDDFPPPSTATTFYVDESRSIISANDSPDVPFRYSLNPYRGCEHGCAYCYARPTHEYFGLSAGLDFETKVFVKPNAPDLFREWLNRSGWQPEMIAFSGVTDCYQPIERKLKLTRQCLDVAHEAHQPVGVITKNALVTRDIDLLAEMTRFRTVHVSLSITTLDAGLARAMEPRTSAPSARLRAVRELCAAGIPTGVMVAPIIPGLNDSEIPAILRAAADAGAESAGYVLLRLPGAVRPIFLDWLARAVPTKADRVIGHIRSTRRGKLSESEFGARMRGTGELAAGVERTFRVFARRYGLNRRGHAFDTSAFRPPRIASGQLRLF